MSRLQQQYPGAYGVGGNLTAEFANVIRYLNAAELGNKTVGELLQILFDENGEFAGPVELRSNNEGDLQYRIGSYPDTETGWLTLILASDIRGADGRDVGTILEPVFQNRYDATGTAAQTDFDYAHDAGDEILVYKDGILLRQGALYDYTADPLGGSSSTGSVTLTSALAGGEKLSVFRIRTSTISGFTRANTIASDGQAVFPFEFPSVDTEIVVYKNGILLREGGSEDYVATPENNVVTLMSPAAASDLITILTVENTSEQTIAGLMLETKYVDSDTGLIPINKISVPDASLSIATIIGLSTALADAAPYVGAVAPENPTAGKLWQDTSTSPNKLKFYDGASWLLTSPDSSLPSFKVNNALQFIRVNTSGTGLEYADIDFSSVIAITQKGAANGVAPLDSSGRLPYGYLPSILASDTLYYFSDGPQADENVVIKRVFKQKIQITNISLQTDSGTCDVQLEVGGVPVGDTYSVSSSKSEFAIGSVIEIDSTDTSKDVGFVVTNQASANNLVVAVAYNIVS